MFSRLTLALAAVLLFVAPNVKADTIDLTATGVGTNINLVLTATLASPGVYDITGLSGTVDGYSATLLATSAPGAVTTNLTGGILTTYDNILFLNQPYFDDNGLAFISNGIIGNLYYSGGYIYSELGGHPPVLQAATVHISPAPEPGTLALLCSAGLLLAVMLRFRK